MATRANLCPYRLIAVVFVKRQEILAGQDSDILLRAHAPEKIMERIEEEYRSEKIFRLELQNTKNLQWVMQTIKLWNKTIQNNQSAKTYNKDSMRD